MFLIHGLLSEAVGVPELAIDDSDAENLGFAVTNVSRHYIKEPDGKIMDWFLLLIAIGCIYQPRIAQYKKRKKEESAEKQQPIIQHAM